MSQIEEAQDRLERAVARLEHARRAQSDRIAEIKKASSEAPNVDEVNGLIRALDEAQRENAALVAEREAMADRVDAIIGRLRSVAGMEGAGR